MRICLVNPPITMAARYGDLSRAGSRLPPLNVALLAAVAREAGHAVSLLDCEALQWTEQESARQIIALKPDLLGATATTTSVVPAGRLLELVRREAPGIRTCAGGVHVSCEAEATLRRFPALDLCVVGEGERTLVELAAALESGRDLRAVPGLVVRHGDALVRTAARPYLTAQDLDRLPWPAWDLLPDLARTYRPALHSFRKLPCTSLITSRGCPGRCTFCDRTVFGSRTRGFSARYLLGMTRHLMERYGIREIIFHDDNFVSLRPRLHEFCNLLIDAGLRLTWSCNGRVDQVTPEILALMRRAGCWHIAYGIESGSQEILDRVHKGITLEQIRRTVAWTWEAGIEPRGYFLIGVPGETRETLEATRRFVRSLPLSDIQMSLYTPHPGTELAAQLRAAGHPPPDWELDGGWRVTYVPEGLTAADLAQTQRRCLRDFYFRPRTVLRYARRLAGSPGAWKTLALAALQLVRFRGAVAAAGRSAPRGDRALMRPLRRAVARLRFGEPVIVVTGLPRSGTSLLMQMLAAGGLPLAADGARAADEDNPRGYGELERVKNLASGDVSWVGSCRGKALKVVSPLLRHLPAGIGYRVLFVQRDLAEVLPSQRRMLERRVAPPEGDDGALREAYAAHLAQVRRHLEGCANVAVLFLEYQGILADPRGEARRVNRFLGKRLDVDAMAAAVDPALRHHDAGTG